MRGVRQRERGTAILNVWLARLLLHRNQHICVAARCVLVSQCSREGSARPIWRAAVLLRLLGGYCAAEVRWAVWCAACNTDAHSRADGTREGAQQRAPEVLNARREASSDRRKRNRRDTTMAKAPSDAQDSIRHFAIIPVTIRLNPAELQRDFQISLRPRFTQHTSMLADRRTAHPMLPSMPHRTRVVWLNDINFAERCVHRKKLEHRRSERREGAVV